MEVSLIPKRKRKKENVLAANVSTLKTHLGQYLKKVKEGAEVVVLDRQLPVAKLVAYQDEETHLETTTPKLELKEVFRRMAENDRKRRPTRLKRDSLSYLNEDRGTR